MKNKSDILYLLLIVVLGVLLYFSVSNKRTRIVEMHTTDTIYQTVVDTITIVKLKPIRETNIDTIYLEPSGNDETELFVVQQHFHQDSVYDAWISGIQPLGMDSIKVYNKVEYKTINNEVVKEIYPRTTDFYLTLDALSVDNKFSPNIGLDIKFKKDFIVGAKVGYYDKSLYYGIKFGIKLNRR